MKLTGQLDPRPSATAGGLCVYQALTTLATWASVCRPMASTLAAWLAEERQRDAQAGLPRYISDPAALGVLAAMLQASQEALRASESHAATPAGT